MEAGGLTIMDPLNALRERLRSLWAGFHRFKSRHLTLQFVWHSLIALVVIVFFCSIFAWVGDLSSDQGWIVIYALVILVPFLIWFLFRLWRKRGATPIAGIIAALAILYAVEVPLLDRDVARAIAALPPVSKPTILAIDTYDISEFKGKCGDLCIEVLAKSRGDVRTGDQLYRLVAGDQCRSDALRASYFQFLSLGFSGICARQFQVDSAQSSEGLLRVIVDHCSNRPLYDAAACADLPTRFRGTIVTVTESGSGSPPRMVRRWLEGIIEPHNSWYALLGLEYRTVGPWLDYSGRLSRALNLELQGCCVPGRDDLDQVLMQLEIFLDDPNFAAKAWEVFDPLARVRGSEDPSIVKRHIALELAKPTSPHRLAGLNMIIASRTTDVALFRESVEALKKDPDKLVAEFAKRALRRINGRQPGDPD